MASTDNTILNDILDAGTGTSIGFEIKEKIAALQEALLSSHPSLPVLLRTIHTQLRKDPEIVTLPGDEEIGIIVNCLKRQTQVELVTAPVKKTSDATALKKAVKAAGSNSVDLF